MSFWKQNQKLLMQRWDLHRRRIEREVAERRRDLVRRNMRQSSEWTTYEPYTDWYLEREVEAFVAAVEEVSGTGPFDIDDESLDEMDRMMGEMIDRRRQLAPAEALREFGPQYARVKGSARVGLLRVQSARRSEQVRSSARPAQAPVRRVQRPSSETPAPVEPAATPVAVAPSPTRLPETSRPDTGSPPVAATEPTDGRADSHTLAQNLRRLAQLVQQLPDPEEQVETLEELQFVAEEATVEPDRRKLRMVGAALERIRSRIAQADPENAPTAVALADPIRRWFEVTA